MSAEPATWEPGAWKPRPNLTPEAIAIHKRAAVAVVASGALSEQDGFALYCDVGNIAPEDAEAHRDRYKWELHFATGQAQNTATNGPNTWQPVDLADIVQRVAAGEIVGPTPSLMLRTDGPALLYPGELHSLAGEPESGKGWLMVAETARLITAGHRVAYIDGEDTAPNIVQRLFALGAPAAAIVDHLAYVRPEAGLQDAALIDLLAAGPYALAVLDGQTELYSLMGLDPYANQDVPTFLRNLARPLADNGAAVVLIDHVTKDAKTRGRFAIGGQHKLAGIAVAYGVETIDRPSRQHTGRVKLIVQKDRHGHVRAHAAGKVIATATITPTDNGARVAVELHPPDATDRADTGRFRPTFLMERVSRYIEHHDGTTQRQILTGTTGHREHRIGAIQVLADEGYVDLRKDGQAIRHHALKPYREADDTPTVPTDPNRSQTDPTAQPVPTVPTVPIPLQGGTVDGNGTQEHNTTDPTTTDPNQQPYPRNAIYDDDNTEATA